LTPPSGVLPVRLRSSLRAPRRSARRAFLLATRSFCNTLLGRASLPATGQPQKILLFASDGAAAAPVGYTARRTDGLSAEVSHGIPAALFSRVSSLVSVSEVADLLRGPRPPGRRPGCAHLPRQHERRRGCARGRRQRRLRGVHPLQEQWSAAGLS